MKTRNVRTRQWRKHYRFIRALNKRARQEVSSGPTRIVVATGLIDHTNRIALKHRRNMWLPRWYF